MDIIFDGVNCRLEKSRYWNGRPALQLYRKDSGVPFLRATVNVPEVDLNENEVIIKNYEENEGIFDVLVEKGIIESTNRFIKVGFVACPVATLKI